MVQCSQQLYSTPTTNNENQLYFHILQSVATILYPKGPPSALAALPTHSIPLDVPIV